jgi:hypothetical protein
MNPNSNRWYDFSPLLPGKSKGRQVMQINDVDFDKLRFTGRSKPTTVYDRLTNRTYIVKGEKNDSRLVG